MHSLATVRCMSIACLYLIAPVSYSQDFVAYEGRNAIQEGDGGAKKSIDDVDMWADGAPPRKFTLLGFITDRRYKSGLIGMI